MELSTLLVCLILFLKSAVTLYGLGDGPQQKGGITEGRTGARVKAEALPLKCKIHGSTHLPAFSQDGDYLIGGVFAIHRYKHTVKHNYTSVPQPQKCTGRLVKRRPGLEDERS